MKPPYKILIVLVVIFEVAGAQIPQGVLHRQSSRVSRFEFALFNSGLLYGDYWEIGPQFNIRRGFAPALCRWPRGYDEMGASLFSGIKGLMLLAKKDGDYYFREATSIVGFDEQQGPFYGMVPGRIGDPNAGYDERYGGVGWKYVDDRDYIVYSSADYDSNGVDISGNNYNDWPIRYVNGSPKYIAVPFDRYHYKPAYFSDEEFFTVYKDTDTRSYRDFLKSRPLELEVHQYVYTWGSKGLKDVVIFRYDYINKGKSMLDSCYFLWAPGVEYSMPQNFQGGLRQYLITHTQVDLVHNLLFQMPVDTLGYEYALFAVTPPVLGTSLLCLPAGYHYQPGGIKEGGMEGEFTTKYYWYDSIRTKYYLWVDIFSDTSLTEASLYQRLIRRIIFNPPKPYRLPLQQPIILTTPFTLSPGDTARFVSAVIFAKDTLQVKLLNDIANRVYQSGFKTPSPPNAPRVTVKALNRGIYLEWDRSAEASIDPIIPASLGKPFAGYRVYRAVKQQGPYTLLKESRGDTLAHDYIDVGSDIGGLKNNVTYYYKVASFDDGVPAIELEPMESNAAPLEATPAVAPSNVTASTATGETQAGTLGDILSVVLKPTGMTSYASFFEGRQLRIKLTSITDQVRYLLPVTIEDTVYARIQHELIDPKLNVHGTPQTSGVKQATATIADVFGLKGASLEVSYRFEQLADSFKVAAAIESNQGTDVPVIVDDSLKYSGIYEYSPFSCSPRTLSLRFTEAGIDTAQPLFKRYIPYITVEAYDEQTGQKLDTGYTFVGTGIRNGVGSTFTGKKNRYYLSGTLSNGEQWDFGHVFSLSRTRVVIDYTDRGKGSGKPEPTFSWASGHRTGTKDFSVGDKLTIRWLGGVKAVFPNSAELVITAARSQTDVVTDELMDNIKIVPNPYLVRHLAQRGLPRLYFNYLPDECTIRIYTVALDLVRTLQHKGGSREEWDMQTEGGQLVASQLLFAHIEASNGAKTIKKFSVIVGK
jgi:hypothetical protein